MKRKLTLYRELSEGQIILVTNKRIIDYSQLLDFLSLSNRGFEFYLHRLFSEQKDTNFIFIGNCKGTKNILVQELQRITNKNLFPISNIGLDVCHIHQLPSIEDSDYEGFFIRNCGPGKKGLFYINVITPCGLKGGWVLFDSCGGDRFVANNLEGLRGATNLSFKFCGANQFFLYDTQGLSSLQRLRLEFCGAQKFYINSQGLNNLQSLYLYRCSLDSFTLHEPHNYNKVQELHIESCGVYEGMQITNTKGFQNLQKLVLINCAKEGRDGLVISDLSFLKTIESITINNCGLAGGIRIEDTQTILPLEKAYILLDALTRSINEKDFSGPTIIRLRVDSFKQKDKFAFNNVKKKLENYGWVISITT